MGNISTRLRVETGDNVLIGGFIVTGTQPKKVIVRAIGPSLPVPGKLANPTLELHAARRLDCFQRQLDGCAEPAGDHRQHVAPTNDLESAILTTLPANGTGYTAIVRGANDGTGVGLVEVYDLDRTANSNLANISTRGFVQTGDNVMIGGFILTGTGMRKVIVRAIGPSLPVPGALADPTLELVQRQWRDRSLRTTIGGAIRKRRSSPARSRRRMIWSQPSSRPFRRRRIPRSCAARMERPAWPWSKSSRSLSGCKSQAVAASSSRSSD